MDMGDTVDRRGWLRALGISLLAQTGDLGRLKYGVTEIGDKGRYSGKHMWVEGVGWGEI